MSVLEKIEAVLGVLVMLVLGPFFAFGLFLIACAWLRELYWLCLPLFT